MKNKWSKGGEQINGNLKIRLQTYYVQKKRQILEFKK